MQLKEVVGRVCAEEESPLVCFHLCVGGADSRQEASLRWVKTQTCS